MDERHRGTRTGGGGDRSQLTNQDGRRMKRGLTVKEAWEVPIVPPELHSQRLRRQREEEMSQPDRVWVCHVG